MQSERTVHIMPVIIILAVPNSGSLTWLTFGALLLANKSAVTAICAAIPMMSSHTAEYLKMEYRYMQPTINTMFITRCSAVGISRLVIWLQRRFDGKVITAASTASSRLLPISDAKNSE